jgi:chromate transporter
MTDAPAALEAPEAAARSPLREIALLFAKLGVTAFGGPAAHVAMMESEVVRRRRWLSREEFLDYLGASQLIPGPNSTELAMHVGFARGGWRGLVVAGVCFIVPAATIVLILAWGYVRFGALPETRGILHGVQPVVVAVIVQALWQLGRTALKGWGLAMLGIAALVAAAAGVHELIVLATAGLIAALVGARNARGQGARVAAILGPSVIASSAAVGRAVAPASAAVLAAGGGSAIARAGLAITAGATATAASASGAAVSLGALFGVFLKIGSVLFGSGYVLVAFLRGDLVDRLGWLTDRQLLDAVAAGQVTPGPVLTTATFVGFLLAGPAGAAVATIGIFLPAFVFVAASGGWVRRARRSAWAAGLLDGVNVASLALIATTAIGLARSALIDPTGVALAIGAAVLLALRVNSVWVVLAGATIGFVMRSGS